MLMLLVGSSSGAGDTAAVILGFLVLFLLLLLPYGLYAVLWKQRWEDRFLREFNRDERQRARIQMDRYAKRFKRARLGNRKIPHQRGRLMALWLLGELDELRAELSAHNGSASFTANVEMNGVLALAIAAPEERPALAARLDALAGQVTQGSTRLLAGMRQRAALVAKLGASLAGAPLDEADAKRLLDGLYADPLLTRVMLLRAMIVAADVTGRSSLRLQKMLANLTPVLAAPAAA